MELRISSRDLEIFRQLARYRFLRSRHLLALCGGEVFGFVKRLKTLTEAGYLARPEQQREYSGHMNRTRVYELTKLGEEQLDEVPDPVVFLWRGAKSLKEFKHSVMVCDIVSNIEIGAIQAGSRLITWSEILAKAPWMQTEKDKYAFHLPVKVDKTVGKRKIKITTPVVPDSIFGILAPDNAAKFFALEADLGSEPLMRSDLAQSSYMKKELQYEYVLSERIYKKRLGLNNFTVLSVAKNKARAESIIGFLQPSKYMLAQVHPAIPDPSPRADGYLYREAWLSGVKEPIYISSK